MHDRDYRFQFVIIVAIMALIVLYSYISRFSLAYVAGELSAKSYEFLAGKVNLIHMAKVIIDKGLALYVSVSRYSYCTTHRGCLSRLLAG